MVIRKPKDLSENYKTLPGSHTKLTVNYTSFNKDIDSISQSQEEMKNTISKLNNIVEGIKKGQMKQRIESVSWRTR